MGIALFISASVLLGCSDSEKTEIVEKKDVFYKIKMDLKAGVKPPDTDSPAQIKQIIEDKPMLAEKKIDPPQLIASVKKKGVETPSTKENPALLPQTEIPTQHETAAVEKKMSDVTPTEEERPDLLKQKNYSKKISAPPVFNKEPVDIKKTSPEKKSVTGKKEKHPEEVQFWRYNAKKEDTLWDIAKKYYGEGAYYPVLLEHNPHVGLYTIGTGVTLNILKNGKNASKIYKKIIIRKDGHFFWRYSVADGDTLQSIIQKYYKKGQAKSDIPNIDKSSELKAGEKIWILIE
jgi:hypothetical protein